jgi:hypothetical protein
MKYRYIQPVFYQMMNGMFKGSRLELLLKIDHDQGVLVVIIRDESRHEITPFSLPHFIKTEEILGVFLQPQRQVNRQPERSVGCPSEERALLNFLLCAFYQFDENDH